MAACVTGTAPAFHYAKLPTTVGAGKTHKAAFRKIPVTHNKLECRISAVQLNVNIKGGLKPALFNSGKYVSNQIIAITNPKNLKKTVR